MKKFWDKRYEKEVFAYGKEPNKFFKIEIDKLKKGKILLPADGEGRNSVYASSKGWDVFACDMSEQAKIKAEQLAIEQKVTLHYDVGDFGELSYKEDYYDSIALVYAHFPPNKKSEYHKMIDNYLKKGGFIIFEAFSKNHLKYNSINSKVGGPKDIDTLFSINEIKKDFSNYEFLTLIEEKIELIEGSFHIGTASVIRFVAKKK